jgi:hypothetical protein
VPRAEELKAQAPPTPQSPANFVRDNARQVIAHSATLSAAKASAPPPQSYTDKEDYGKVPA